MLVIVRKMVFLVVTEIILILIQLKLINFLKEMDLAGFTYHEEVDVNDSKNLQDLVEFIKEQQYGRCFNG